MTKICRKLLVPSYLGFLLLSSTEEAGPAQITLIILLLTIFIISLGVLYQEAKRPKKRKALRLAPRMQGHSASRRHLVE